VRATAEAEKPAPPAPRRAVLLSLPCALAAAPACAGGLDFFNDEFSRATGGDQALRRVDNAVASALIGAVYDSLVAVWDGPEADMQRTLAKLRESEMAGFQRVYADMRVKATPQEITGEKWVGGYFQFLSYCTWKLAARTVQDPEDVRAFYQSVGRRVAGRLLPGRIAALQEAAAAAPTGRAPASATAAAVQDLMGRLQQAGYLQSWSLIWGEQPSLGNAKSLGFGSLPITEDPSTGVTQGVLKRSPSEPASDMTPEESPTTTSQGPDAALGLQGGIFQVRALRPADLDVTVTMRAEEDGRFWPRFVPCTIDALLRAAGARDVSTTEFFFQDAWQSPPSVTDKILLSLGDPLFQVRVPWTPTSLILDVTVL